MRITCFRISNCCFLFLSQSCAVRGALVVAGWWQVVRSTACCVLAVLLRVRFEQVALVKQVLLLFRRIVCQIRLYWLLSNSRYLWLVLPPQT